MELGTLALFYQKNTFCISWRWKVPFRSEPACFLLCAPHPPLPCRPSPWRWGGGIAEGVSRTSEPTPPDQITLDALLPWLTCVVYLASALFQVPASLLEEPTESWALGSYQSLLPSCLVLLCRSWSLPPALARWLTPPYKSDSGYLPVPGNTVFSDWPCLMPLISNLTCRRWPSYLSWL